VSVTCPAGHVSSTTDYCDQCGARIEAVMAPADTGTTPATSPSPVSAPCPQCGTPRSGRDRFCESCGFDFARIADPPPVAAPPAWAATVGPDRDQYTRVAPDGLAFPDHEVARTFVLDAARFRIGRRRTSGADAPEIELSDPAVSRLHASLVRVEGGDWAIVDEGSANGTTVNADPDPIPPHTEVPLRNGDRVHLGAWTTITVAAR
jgi:FHA domain-containing protein/double zinc ribbon protein